MVASSGILHHVTNIKSSQGGFLNMTMNSLHWKALHRHLNPTEHLWEVVEVESHIIGVKLRNLQQLCDAIMSCRFNLIELHGNTQSLLYSHFSVSLMSRKIHCITSAHLKVTHGSHLCSNTISCRGTCMDTRWQLVWRTTTTTILVVYVHILQAYFMLSVAAEKWFNSPSRTSQTS